MIHAAYALPDRDEPADGPDVASTLGYSDWCDYVLARADRYPAAARLACFHWSDRPEDLAHDLEALLRDCTDPDAAHVTAQVIAALRELPDGATFYTTDGEPAGDEDGEGDEPEPPAEPSEHDSAHELALHAVEHALACDADGTDAQPVLDALAELAHDPELFERVAGGGVAKALDEPYSADEYLAAAIDLVELARAAGADPEDYLGALHDRGSNTHTKGFDPSEARDAHGRWSETGGGGGTGAQKPGAAKDARETKRRVAAEKKQQKEHARAEAERLTNELLAHQKRGKPLPPDATRALIPHLAHLRHEDLSKLRKALADSGATFRGTRLKADRVAALVKWAKGEVHVRRRGKADSVLQAVVDHGGIDPKSHAFLGHYRSMGHAVQDGVPLAAFKRAGGGLDALAQELHNSGLVTVPEGTSGPEHVLKLLRGRGFTNARQEDDFDKQYDEYLRGVAESYPTADEKFDPNAVIAWDDEPAGFWKAVAWDEQQHHRERGRFARTEGAHGPHRGSHEPPHADPTHDPVGHEPRDTAERKEPGWLTRNTLDRLPPPARRVAEVISKGYFLTFVAAHKAVRAVAEKRGLSGAETQKLARALTGVDLALGGSRSAAAAVALGVPALALPASFVPWASVGYLAYSTARDPLAVAAAAVDAIAAAAKRLAARVTKATVHLDHDDYDFAEVVAGAMAAHDWSDYYHALLVAGVRHAGDVAEGVRLADAAWEERETGEQDDAFEKAVQWDSAKHPRDDNGRFVSVAAIHAAKTDPAKAKELRKRVTDPEERKKLDAALAGETDIGHTAASQKRADAAAKREKKTADRDEARAIRDRLFGQHQAGEALSADDLRALIPHLATMTAAELSSLRTFLAGPARVSAARPGSPSGGSA
jgi:hypothetical protein